MGGELEIESEEGKGSTFFFTLTLDKIKDVEPRKIVNMLGYTIGLLGSEGRIHENIKRNLEAYVTYTGAEFDLYDEKEIFKSESKRLPDILFIDHSFHQRKGELDVFLKLECKTVLMTTADKKKSIEEIAEKIDRVLYKPLNLTKTFKALEVVYEKQVPTSETKKTETAGTSFSGLHVLVAEDNSINQKLIKNVLNGFGIDVTLASNGEEAFDLRMHNDYDMIFMDIQMPVLGGIEATQKILAFEEKNRLPHIPIVALTANALSGDREKYIDAGMDNYLSKPIDLERLNILLQEYFPEAVQAAKSDDEAHQSKSETIEKKNESKIYKPEQQEVEVEERDQKEEKTPVIKKDILIFHSLALIANLYERMLSNLGYSVEKVMDEQEFMDRLENSDEIYRFVIFQGRPFKNVKCLISDLVRSTGAEPFVILPRDESAANYCCRSLEEGSDIAVVREKLAHG